MARKIYVLQDYLRMGGTERNTLALCAKLQEEGNAVTLLTARTGGPLSSIAQNARFLSKSMQPFDLGLNWFPPNTLSELYESQPNQVILMGRVANEVGWKIKRTLPKAELIASIRTGRKFTKSYLQTLRVADQVWVNSQYAAERAEYLGIDASRIILVENFPVHALSNEQRLRQRADRRKALDVHDPDTRIFLKVAAFRPGKRHAELLKVFADYGNVTNWILVLVGAGPRERSCKRLAKRLRIEKNVIFKGLQIDVSPYYYASDYAISASSEESNSNFIQEAGRAGLPIIALRSGGTEKHQQSPNAEDIWIDDIKELKAELAKLLKSTRKYI